MTKVSFKTVWYYLCFIDTQHCFSIDSVILGNYLLSCKTCFKNYPMAPCMFVHTITFIRFQFSARVVLRRLKNHHFRVSCAFYTFKRFSQSCEKRLLGSSCLSLSVCPSVRMEQLGSHWMDFNETLYLSFSRNYVEEFQVSLKSDKSNGYFT